ncbi:MAG: HigA family addiction module antidote protein [Treponema sp.]|jgi:addiction module HigA family antidote|nr:HigA family addiction module antidote protein [Treponema sp.]
MAKTEKNPGAVLQTFIDKYQINPFSLSKSAGIYYKTIRDIISGSARITVPIALRLGKFFGTTPQFWLDLQISSEIKKLSADKKFQSKLKNITKAGKQKSSVKEKSAKRKTKTLREKRKKAVKIPGAKKSGIGKI